MRADAGSVRERYRRFARVEAPGRSDLYADWAAGVAGDTPDGNAVAELLARIPAEHRQPPLVFAVTRLLGAPEEPFAAWATWVRSHAEVVVAECGRRGIQTNEPLRCAALLPALALIDGPIALLEVGASAGLCLYPDRYSYRYATPTGIRSVDPDDGVSSVVLTARLSGTPDLRMPEIVWRAGIDLRPLDAGDPADRAWLTGLVWPGEAGRADRVEAALDIVAADPPRLVAGDAATALGPVAASLRAVAPDATLVVTTPGVLAHVPPARRGDLIAAARAAGRWITLDDPGLHDGWAAPIDPADWPRGSFALGVDGDVVAAADPLGGFVEWRGPDAVHRY
jgi:hypothetical protein